MYYKPKHELLHLVARVPVVGPIVDPWYDTAVIQTNLRSDTEITTLISCRVRVRCVRHVAWRVVLDLSSVEHTIRSKVVGVHGGGFRDIRDFQHDQRRSVQRVSIQDGDRGYGLGNHGVHFVGDAGLWISAINSSNKENVTYFEM